MVRTQGMPPKIAVLRKHAANETLVLGGRFVAKVGST